jgi:hypothetical protein
MLSIMSSKLLCLACDVRGSDSSVEYRSDLSMG